MNLLKREKFIIRLNKTNSLRFFGYEILKHLLAFKDIILRLEKRFQFIKQKSVSVKSRRNIETKETKIKNFKNVTEIFLHT